MPPVHSFPFYSMDLGKRGVTPYKKCLVVKRKLHPSGVVPKTPIEDAAGTYGVPLKIFFPFVYGTTIALSPEPLSRPSFRGLEPPPPLAPAQQTLFHSLM